MKKLTLILCSIVFATTAFSQSNAELKKEIKALLKSPEKYKALKDQSNLANQHAKTITQLSSEKLNLEKELTQLKTELSSKNQEISSLISNSFTNNNTSSVQNNSATTQDHSGGKYRVQIGLFQNIDLTYILDNPKQVMHEYVDGLNRYTIGNFESANEAELFKNEIRRLGINDAFVTYYNSGVRDMFYDNAQQNTNSYTPPPPSQPVNNTNNYSQPTRSGFNNNSNSSSQKNFYVEPQIKNYDLQKQIDNAKQNYNNTKQPSNNNTSPENKGESVIIMGE